MAYALHVDVIDPGDGSIKVTHIFWGLTEEETRTYFREHLDSCEYFAAAVKQHRIAEELEEIDEDELPEAEEIGSEEDAE